MAWTTPKTWNVGDLLTASDMNTYVRDNTKLIPRELDYAQITANVAISATTEGTAQTVITGNAVTYDGSTRVKIEFYSPKFNISSGNTGDLVLLRDTTVIGHAEGTTAMPYRAEVFETPASGSHTYTAKAYGNSACTVQAGPGGSGQFFPAFLRVTTAPQ